MTDERTAPVEDRMHGVRAAAVGLALALLAAAGYASFIGAPFLYDDVHTIRDNAALREHLSPWYFFTHPGSASRLPATMTRPLLTLSYALNYRLLGPGPDGFRFVNLLIHLLNAFMIYRLTRYVPGVRRMAAWAGALFVVHPLHASGVGLVSNRSTLLFSAFYLAAMLVFARARAGVAGYKPAARAGTIAGLAALYAAGLLCKEAAATLPAALVLWDAVFGQAREGRPRARRFTIQAVAALGVVLIAFLAYRRVMAAPVLFAEARPWAVWRYAAAQVPVALTYLRMMLLPTHLALEHDAWMPAGPGELMSARFLIAAAGLVALAAGAWIGRKRSPSLGFGVLFAAVYLLPVSSVVPLTVVINENRPYLGSVVMIWGLLIVAGERDRARAGSPAAQSAAQPAARFRWRAVALAVVVALLVVLTAARGRVLQSEAGAWREAVGNAPDLGRAWVNLGVVYSSYGRTDAARACYERAVGLDRCNATALGNLGNLALRDGARTEAQAYYRRALDCGQGYEEEREKWREQLLKIEGRD
jgi:protein O-mannosyl-transferase